MTICVLGCGAWGLAIATVLAHNGHSVIVWCHLPEYAKEINNYHTNTRYLPGKILDKKITATADIHDALSCSDLIFEAIPVQFLRSVITEARPYYTKNQSWVILSKGIEQKTLLLPSQIIATILGPEIESRMAIVAGPSFAHELIEQQPTAVTLATTHHLLQTQLENLLHTSYFRTYSSTDIIGTQIGGALKNVIALAIGILDGAGYQDNTKSFIVTRSINEIINITKAVGGSPETILELSGIGDLILTCMGKSSRNLYVGREFGMGKTLDTIISTTGYTPESLNTIRSCYELIQQKNITAPLITDIYHMLFNNLLVKDFIGHNINTR